jgi:DNA polymerase I-like protein with 3'-5' exonuclease and polymerase domains/uracil-DNA glycosylase
MDPRRLGARCDECPLRGCGPPVPSQGYATAWFALVGEAPGEEEVKRHTPFIGRSGEYLDQTLLAAGVKRAEVFVTNACLCRPPGNSMKAVTAKVRAANARIRKENVKRAKGGEDPLPLKLTPAEACAPRLLAELAPFDKIMVVGAVAVRAVLGVDVSVMEVRGGFVEGHLMLRHGLPYLWRPEGEDTAPPGGRPVKVAPTLHPAFVLRKKRWGKPFRVDIHRAVAWFKGAKDFVPPLIVYNPTPEALEAFLDRLTAGGFGWYDLETDGVQPRVANVDCFSVGTGDEVMSVGLYSTEFDRRVYSAPDEERIRAIFVRWLADERVVKVGQNQGYWDKIVCRHQFGVDPKPNLDVLLLHRLVESELPHNLSYIASVYTNAPPWKTDRAGRKRGTVRERDADRWLYCSLDTAITARATLPLVQSVAIRNQGQLIPYDHAIQEVCVGMHENGMWVDQEVRADLERQLVKEILVLRTALRKSAGRPDYNGGSYAQVADLLFTDWKLEPPVPEDVRYTETGAFSTDDEVIRSLLALPNRILGHDDATLGKARRQHLHELRMYRKKMKELGTYVAKLRPEGEQIGGLGWDEDESLEERDYREERGLDKRGVVSPDGRIHTGWNAHTVVSGRLSSSKPFNAQNVVKRLRAMVRAAPGHVLVGADMDQLELRIAASRWLIRMYLEAFTRGADPHASTADGCFPMSNKPGLRFREMAGFPGGHWEGAFFVRDGAGDWDGAANRTRDLSKRIQYNGQYGGGEETMLRVMQEAEDDDGNLTYLALTLPEVRVMRANWLARAPEYVTGWTADLQRFREQGFLAEPVLGRRRDFLDGEEEAYNEILNFCTQAAAASIVNLGTLDVVKEIPFGRWGPGTGLIAQVHDSLVLEVPIAEAKYAADVLKRCLCRTIFTLPGVTFTAKPKIGVDKETGAPTSWAKV